MKKNNSLAYLWADLAETLSDVLVNGGYSELAPYGERLNKLEKFCCQGKRAPSGWDARIKIDASTLPKEIAKNLKAMEKLEGTKEFPAGSKYLKLLEKVLAELETMKESQS
jgi:hypothetical protein